MGKAWRLAALGFLLLALFQLLTFNVLAGRTAAFDRHWTEAAAQHAAEHPWLLVVMRRATHLGDWVILGTAGVLALLVLLWRRRFALAALYVLVALGGRELNIAQKQVYERPRPPPELRDVTAQHADASYPSGHTMAATINFGLLGYCWVRWGRGRRPLVAALLCAAVLLVAATRVYLRAHWVTDVLGGMCAGGAWLALWVAGAEALRHRRARRIATASAPPQGEQQAASVLRIPPD